MASNSWSEEPGLKGWPSQDIKTGPYRDSLDSACFPPALPHGCTNTNSLTCIHQICAHKEKGKIFENQDLYILKIKSWFFSQPSKAVRPQLTEPLKRCQARENTTAGPHFLRKVQFFFHASGLCRLKASAPGLLWHQRGCSRDHVVTHQCTLDTSCAQLQQLNKSQAYFERREGGS